MSQREFARRAGVTQSTIMRIENHQQNVTLETLERLCQSFHVDVGELFPVTRMRPDYRAGKSETRASVVHEPPAPRVDRRQRGKPRN